MNKKNLAKSMILAAALTAVATAEAAASTPSFEASTLLAVAGCGGGSRRGSTPSSQQGYSSTSSSHSSMQNHSGSDVIDQGMHQNQTTPMQNSSYRSSSTGSMPGNMPGSRAMPGATSPQSRMQPNSMSNGDTAMNDHEMYQDSENQWQKKPLSGGGMQDKNHMIVKKPVNAENDEMKRDDSSF